MYRFVAFHWDSHDAGKSLEVDQLADNLCADSPSWELVLDHPGLRILHRRTANSAYQSYALHQHAGVVLGRVFAADCGLVGPTFREPETTSIVQSRGRFFVEHYWGHYVMFLRGCTAEGLHIVRDPTGGLPCYMLTRAGLRLFLSDVRDLVTLRLGNLSINWPHVASYFIHNRQITEATGLSDVHLLAAGQCLSLIGEDRQIKETRQFYWNPREILDGARRTSEHHHRELRRVIQGCVTAWSSCYSNVVHELSGGLDSSIVAAALRAAGQAEVKCFHFFTDIAAGDEREYARSVAAKLKYQLMETKVTASQRSFKAQLSDVRLATPTLVGFLPESETAKRQLVESEAAGAVFSGQGGDHLFQHGKNNLTAAESLQRQGIGASFLHSVLNASRTSNQSVWSILNDACRYGLLHLRYDPYDSFEAPSILAADARVASSSAYVHPWVCMAQRVPASKIKFIFDLVDTQLFYLRPYAAADQIHPLISQPVVECCLRIPSYEMALGGVSRGLVRTAFRDALPAKVVDRRSKGTTTSYFNQLLLKHLPEVRELLLDGRLVQARVLDRTVLEEQLSERSLVQGEQFRSVLDAVRAEAWLRAWQI